MALAGVHTRKKACARILIARYVERSCHFCSKFENMLSSIEQQSCSSKSDSIHIHRLQCTMSSRTKKPPAAMSSTAKPAPPAASLPFNELEGKTKSTNNGRLVAAGMFKKFAAAQNEAAKTFALSEAPPLTKTLDELTVEDCESEMYLRVTFGQFATYLLYGAKTTSKTGCQNLAAQTVTRYFSSAFNYLKDRMKAICEKGLPVPLKKPADDNEWVRRTFCPLSCCRNAENAVYLLLLCTPTVVHLDAASVECSRC
jgi:hypothetical protein